MTAAGNPTVLTSMAAPTALAAALAKWQAEVARVAKISAAAKAHAAKAVQLDRQADEGEAAIAAGHLADAMGDVVLKEDVPTRGEIADRRDRAIGERAAAKAKDEVSNHLRASELPRLRTAVHSAIEPALYELSETAQKTIKHGFGIVQGGLALSGAVHNLQYNRLRDPKLPDKMFNSGAEAYGPAGIVYEQLMHINWGQWPFTLRPDWLPVNGPGGHAYQMPGLHTGEQLIIASLGLENFR